VGFIIQKVKIWILACFCLILFNNRQLFLRKLAMIRVIIVFVILVPLSVIAQTGANLQLQNAQRAASINQTQLTNSSVSQQIQQRNVDNTRINQAKQGVRVQNNLQQTQDTTTKNIDAVSQQLKNP
jgi:preprotein translocase subunit SecF